MEGYVKGVDYEIGTKIDKSRTTYWNILRINAKWYVCDLNVESLKVNIDKKNWRLLNSDNNEESLIDQTSIESADTYFLTNPEEFIFNHYPLNKKYQLLSRKISFKEFQDMNYIYPNFFKSNLKMLSNFSCLIKGINFVHELRIGLSKDLSMSFSHELYIDNNITLNSNLVGVDGSLNVSKHVIIYQEKEKQLLTIGLKLPQNANYKLLIKMRRNDDENPQFVNCFAYKIIHEKVEIKANYFFPQTFTKELGSTYLTVKNKFLDMTPFNGYFWTMEKFSTFTFKSDIKSNKFYIQIYGQNDEFYDPKEYCKENFNSEKWEIKLKFPNFGWFSVNFFVKNLKQNPLSKLNCFSSNNENNEQHKFKPIASYIVAYVSNVIYGVPFPDMIDLSLGEEDDVFSNLELRTEENFTPYQECYQSIKFTFFKRKSCLFHTQLFMFDENNYKFEMNGYSFFENLSEKCEFSINFPLPGLYKFIISTKSVNSNESFKRTYTCLFKVKYGYHGSFEYPFMYDKWKFNENLKLLRPCKTIFTNQNVVFEIQGLHAHELTIKLSENGKIYEFIKENDSWITSIFTGSSPTDLLIQANFNQIFKDFTNLLKFKVLTKDVELVDVESKDVESVNELWRVGSINDNSRKRITNQVLSDNNPVSNKEQMQINNVANITKIEESDPVSVQEIEPTIDNFQLQKDDEFYNSLLEFIDEQDSRRRQSQQYMVYNPINSYQIEETNSFDKIIELVQNANDIEQTNLESFTYDNTENYEGYSTEIRTKAEIVSLYSEGVGESDWKLKITDLFPDSEYDVTSSESESDDELLESEFIDESRYDKQVLESFIQSKQNNINVEKKKRQKKFVQFYFIFLFNFNRT